MTMPRKTRKHPKIEQPVERHAAPESEVPEMPEMSEKPEYPVTGSFFAQKLHEIGEPIIRWAYNFHVPSEEVLDLVIKDREVKAARLYIARGEEMLRVADARLVAATGEWPRDLVEETRVLWLAVGGRARTATVEGLRWTGWQEHQLEEAMAAFLARHTAASMNRRAIIAFLDSVNKLKAEG